MHYSALWSLFWLIPVGLYEDIWGRQVWAGPIWQVRGTRRLRLVLVLRRRLVLYKKESTLVWGSLRVRRRRLLVSALYSSDTRHTAALQPTAYRIGSKAHRLLEFDSMGRLAEISIYPEIEDRQTGTRTRSS